MFGNKVHNNIIGRQIAFFRYFSKYGFIGEIIIIIVIMPKVKEPVSFQTVWLMNLKIKADGFFYY